MNIGLIDVDSHNFPNLALMKICAYHKNSNDNVEWALPLKRYDIVYMSKVFDFTKEYEVCIQADNIIKGGTGYGLENKLPAEIESIYPDYSLYGITNVAYGFLTRGCPRDCQFCIVSKKEGMRSYQVAMLQDFWKGQKGIKLLDPNLLACPDKLQLLNQLVESKAYIDFTQGLDIRFMTDEVIDKIKKLKLKMIHFAWDTNEQSDLILHNLKHFKKQTGINKRKAGVYVLVNYNTEFEFDLYRIYQLKELGYTPYVMIYNKQDAPKKYRELQRWVNNKFIFNSCENFEDYKKYLTKGGNYYGENKQMGTE